MQNPEMVMFGMMSSLRTGNVVFDMTICLIVPYIVQAFVGLSQRWWPRFTTWLWRWRQTQCRRDIIHVQQASRPWEADRTETRNMILINILRQYIGRQVKTKLAMGDIKLSTISAKGEASDSDSGSDGESSSGGEQKGDKKKEPKAQIIAIPPKRERVEIEPGLWFEDKEHVTTSDSEKEDKKKMSTITTLTLWANRHGGEKRIDDFIKKAFDWYVETVEKEEEHARFMYQPLVRDKFASSEERQKPRMYKRYKLSGEKTFRSLFFPEKEKLLKMLKHFTEKTGKYAIKGFPHKLGLLLHGPPGTGKTSLVKAIAEHMGRHIISVPLSRIHTNQELMDVMFDQTFNIKKPKKTDDDDEEDGGLNNKHAFKEVIFLLEDIDAASKVVQRRANDKRTFGEKQMTSAFDRQYSSATIAAMEKAQEERKKKELVMQEEAKKKKLKEAQEHQQEGGGGGGGGGGIAGGDEKNEKKTDSKEEDILLYEKDKLDLAGLLNILDGVVDAPSRVLIMTTNHPDKIDPAVLRPGRVNMKIYMGFMLLAEALQMVRHYYPGVEEEELEKVKAAFLKQQARNPTGFRLSPAEMEQLCAESVTIDELAAAVLRQGTVEE